MILFQNSIKNINFAKHFLMENIIRSKKKKNRIAPIIPFIRECYSFAFISVILLYIRGIRVRRGSGLRLIIFYSRNGFYRYLFNLTVREKL